ncbi:MAG: ABC transporter permease subunit [Anaerolineales bacterium]|nr:ABC transporter permease subunit [Anaerolineales bacterium]
MDESSVLQEERDKRSGIRRLSLSSRATTVLLIPLTILLFLLAWIVVSEWADLPDVILPSPRAVLIRLIVSIADGTLPEHTAATFLEVLGGLVLGITIAAFLGYLIAKSRTLERILSPYIVASQSIPIVAIAPLLVIWFGSGRISKVLISALIVFFPVLVNTVVAIRSVPEDLRDLMRSLRATRWQVFSKLEVPAAMPVLLGGLKIGATLAVIGAVVGEFVAADEGLGFLINLARGMYDTSMVFVAVFTLVALALILYSLVAILEIKLLAWRKEPP